MKWDKKVVKHLETRIFFNGNGKPLLRGGDRFIAGLLKNVRKNIKVLDFGGGVGRFIDVLKKVNGPGTFNFDNYYIYDNSEEMIERAQARNPEQKNNFFSEEKQLKKYDVVVCIDVLQHSKDLETFKATIKKAAALGNCAIFHFWYKEKDFFQEITLQGVKFPELFPGIETIISNLVPEFSPCEVKLFENELPYKCAVLILGNLPGEEKEPAQAPEPVKEDPPPALVADPEPEKKEKVNDVSVKPSKDKGFKNKPGKK